MTVNTYRGFPLVSAVEALENAGFTVLTEEQVAHYPKGAVDMAIAALELAYSYLRDKPVVEKTISEALHYLYRANELHEAAG